MRFVVCLLCHLRKCVTFTCSGLWKSGKGEEEAKVEIYKNQNILMYEDFKEEFVHVQFYYKGFKRMQSALIKYGWHIRVQYTRFKKTYSKEKIWLPKGKQSTKMPDMVSLIAIPKSTQLSKITRPLTWKLSCSTVYSRFKCLYSMHIVCLQSIIPGVWRQSVAGRVNKVQ